jgi:nitrilase
MLGLSICYDLRFPEHYRALVEGGAEILAVPAAFTHATGNAHWHVLLRARAIENLCYVIAPAQAGHHPEGKRTYGRSLIVDPWGEILLEGPSEGAASLVAELDLERLRRLRSAFPVLAHRKRGFTS